MKQSIRHSINNGKEIKFSDRTYMGANPVYAIHPETGVPIKVKKGVPWVNMTKLAKKEAKAS